MAPSIDPANTPVSVHKNLTTHIKKPTQSDIIDISGPNIVKIDGQAAKKPIRVAPKIYEMDGEVEPFE